MGALCTTQNTVMDVLCQSDVVLLVNFNLCNDIEAICLLPTEGDIFEVITQCCALLLQQRQNHWCNMLI